MGEITIEIELENAGDRAVYEQGYVEESAIRTYRLAALVDTGAVMLVLPRNVVERLGLRTQRTVIVPYADERKEERPVAGPLTITIGDRFMNADCIVGPPLSESLIGQVVLEELDLMADCVNRALTSRPESPDDPLLKLKHIPCGSRGS
jgi:predicted aspartyl protease